MKVETIVLPFCEEDFSNNRYRDTNDCPLGRLAKRFLYPYPFIGINVAFYPYTNIGINVASEDFFKVNVKEVRLNGKIIKDSKLGDKDGFGYNHYELIKESINDKTFKTATIKLQFA